jgi:DNA oxidative demethylase
MTATLFSTLPSGTMHLVGFCGEGMQARLVTLCQRLVAEFPLMQPLTKGGRPLSLQVTSWGRAGWFGSEGKYQYLKRHANGRAWPPIPQLVRDLMLKASAEAGFGVFELETVLLNYYPPETGKLGRHQDLTEEDRRSPIVTISLGDSCLFNVGSTNYADRGVDMELRSGDVVVMGGASRLAFHEVKRVMPGTSKLLRHGGRISLTGRKVFSGR